MIGLRTKIAVALVVIIIAGTLGYYNYGKAKSESDARIRASGAVEVTEVTVSPLVGGRLIYMRFDEGDRVEEGDLIARLSLDGLDSEEEAKRAALAREQEQLKALESGNRHEDIMKAEADLRAKEAQLAQAERDSRRYAELLEDDIVPRSEAERYEENARVLRESVAAARQQHILLKKGPREEEIAAQRHAIRQIEAEIDAVRVQISYKEISAPVSGLVLSKNYQLGEVVSPGSQILTLGATSDPWVKVYIPATQLSKISVGQQAEVYVDSPHENPISGRVRAIAQEAEFNPRLSLTQEERANQVFWVKVSLSDENGLVKPGMPADVVFSALPEEAK
ncbi:MAG: HlyD family efflux transporter periplasmic adaptor subunit [Synergistaceae bacterium]|nr:HlyD family efflux transporter periplasmic adaptor subunit [Synergistaceae bacterium]